MHTNKKLIPNYEVISRLGKGANGEVFKAIDLKKDKLVAIKVLTCREERFSTSFKEEFSLLAHCKHPNIVEVYDFGFLQDGRVFFTMEFIDGSDIFKFSENKSYNELSSILFQLLIGLDYIHSFGLTHCDLKPSNILISRDGRAKLTDFGLAITGDIENMGKIRGTLAYLAPEVIRGLHFDNRADLYSLGILLYEIAVGRLPFDKEKPIDLLKDHLFTIPEIPKIKKQIFPKKFYDAVRCLLRKDPNDRFQNVEELLKSLNLKRFKSIKKIGTIKNPYMKAAAFINREAEMNMLERLYMEQRRCSIISGPEGIGKTRLINEIRLSIQLKGGICLSNEKPPDSHIPFFILSSILYSLTDYLKIYGRGLLKKYAPIISTLLPGASSVQCPPIYQSINNKTALFKSLCKFIRESALSIPYPISLLIDDLDKVDEETRDFFLYFVNDINETNITSVITVENKACLEGKIHDRKLYHNISLKPLTKKAVRKIIDSILNIDIKNSTYLIGKIWGLSKGNPLLIEESLNDALRKGIIYRRAVSWQIIEEDLNKIEISKKIEGNYEKYLSSISDEDMRILQIAALIGEESKISYLTQISGFKTEDLLHSISQLRKAGIVDLVYKDSVRKLRFAQPVIRDLIYKTISEKTMIFLHKKVAEFIEKSSEMRIETIYKLAYHFSKANILDKAIQYSLKASEEAETTFSYIKAIDFLTLGIETAKQNAEAIKINDLVELLSKRGKNYIRASKFKEAEKDFHKMHELSISIKNKRKEMLALGNLGSARANCGDIQKALEYYRKALNIAQQSNDEKNTARWFFNIGFCLMSRGDTDRARTYYNRSIKISERMNDAVGTAYSLNAIAVVYNMKSQYAKAIATYTEALDIAERSKVYDLSAMILANIGTIYSSRNDSQNALKYYKKALIKHRKIENKRGILMTIGNIALIHKKQYKYREALKEFLESLRISREIHDDINTAGCLANLGELYQSMGNYLRAKEYLVEAVELGKKIGEGYYTIGALNTLGDNCRIIGEIEDAVKRHEQAMIMAKQSKLKEMMALVCNSLALDYLEIHRIKKPLIQAKKGLKIAEAVKKKEILIDALFVLASTYLAANEYTKCNNICSRGIDISKKEKDWKKECAFYILKSKLPNSMNLRFLKKALGLAEMIRDLELLWEIHFLIGKYYETHAAINDATKEYQKSIEILKIILTNIPDRLLQEKYINRKIRLNALMHITKGKKIMSLEHIQTALNEREKELLPATRNRELQTLITLSALVNNIFDTGRLLESVIDKVIEFTEAQRGFLILFENGGEISFKVTRNIDPEAKEGIRVSQGIVEEVIRTKRSVVVSSAITDRRFRSRFSVVDLDLRAIMCVPLKLYEKVIGLIWVDADLLRRNFTSRDIEFLESLASIATTAIEKSRLYETAISDNVTGLYNNRYFHQRLGEELERAKRYQNLLSICMIDIDNFKDFNDEYGHRQGDKILYNVGGVIKQNIRIPDIPCRYGGDEFVIVLPGVSEHDAFNVVERIRKNTGNLKIYAKTKRLTLSFGIASYPTHDIKGIDDFIEKADIALYQSKQVGGNTISIYKTDQRAIGLLRPNLATIDKWRIVELLNATTKIAALRSGNASELLEKIMDTVLDLARAKRGYIIFTDKSDDFQVKVSRGLSTDLTELRKEIGYSRSVVEETIERKIPVYVEDALIDERFKKKESIRAMELRCIICVPLLIRNHVKGVVYIDNEDHPGVFRKEDIALLAAFANFVGYVIENTSYLEGLLIDQERLQKELRAKYKFENIIGVSSSMNKILKQIASIADSDVSVLIQGETGTGKELIAKAIHYNSVRTSKPIICVNCAAIPESLLESELFGYEKGAFTGATTSKSGKFEAANNGTIFFDEIGDLSLSLQPKLLRVLQSGEFEKLGSTKTKRVDVRVIAASNRDLEELVNEHKFRKDLYYRVAVIKIDVPPLRERKDDIPVLIKHYLQKLCERKGRKEYEIDGPTLASLMEYHYPGNIRELENILQHSIILAQGKTITMNDLPENMRKSIQQSNKTEIIRGKWKCIRKSLFETEKMHNLRKEILTAFLNRSKGNVTKAAKEAGLHRVSLHRLLKKYHINAEEYRKNRDYSTQ